MKRLLLCILIFCLGNAWVFAQTEQTAPTDEETIHLSEGFLRELDNAFSIAPIADPLTQRDTLSIEQLHEWVGEPTDVEAGYFTKPSDRFDSTYFALKLYEKEFMKPMPDTVPKIMFTIGPLGPQKKALATFDLNKLAEYIRPKEIRHRKMSNLAKKSRPDMDLYFPKNNSSVFDR